MAFFQEWIDGTPERAGGGLSLAAPVRSSLPGDRGRATLTLDASGRGRIDRGGAATALDLPAAARFFARADRARAGFPEPTLLLFEKGALIYGWGCLFHDGAELPVAGGPLRLEGRRYLTPKEKGNDVAQSFALGAKRFELSPGGVWTDGGLRLEVIQATDNSLEIDRAITGAQHWFAMQFSAG